MLWGKDLERFWGKYCTVSSETKKILCPTKMGRWSSHLLLLHGIDYLPHYYYLPTQTRHYYMGNFSGLPYYHTLVVFDSPKMENLMTPVVAAWSDHAPSQSSGMPSSLVTSFVSCRVKPWIWNVEQFVTTVLFKWNLKWYFTTCQSITKKAHPTFKKKTKQPHVPSTIFINQTNKKTKKNMYHPMIADFTEVFGMEWISLKLTDAPQTKRPGHSWTLFHRASR